MNRTFLALATALSIFSFAPAHAAESCYAKHPKLDMSVSIKQMGPDVLLSFESASYFSVPEGDEGAVSSKGIEGAEKIETGRRFSKTTVKNTNVKKVVALLGETEGFGLQLVENTGDVANPAALSNYLRCK